MKKQFIKVLMALAFSQSILFTVQAQNNSLHHINSQLRNLFSNLILPPNHKDFLYDMTCHMTDSNLYQTKCPDTIDTDTWYRLYEEMYYSAYDTLQFEAIEDVYSRGNAYYGDTVPIGIMFYDFYNLKDDALTTNLYFDFDTANNTISDKVPQPISPYLDSSIFSAAPLVEQSYFSNPVFRIDPDFFFFDVFHSSHFGSEGTLYIDFDDGNGLVQFSNSSITHHSVNYTTSGTKNIRVVLQSNITRSTIASSNSQIAIHTNQASVPPDSSLNLPGLNVGIYGGCNSDITSGKVVIYLSGFDIMDMVPSFSRNVEMIYAQMISNNRIVQLKNQGYSFIVVDYENSRIDMRFNALYVLNLIEKLKCNLDMEHQFVIMGESMGGLIGRYLMTYMETELYDRQRTSPFFVDAADDNNIGYLSNNPDIFNLPDQWCMTPKKHNTRLLITIDSPHQGANIPISMQYAYSGVLKFFAKYLGINVKSFTTEHNLFLDGQAAQQMMIYHVDTKSGDNYYSHPDKDAFFQQLQQMGDYPQYCKVLAISNGSLSGESQTNAYTLQPRTPGDRIADLELDLYGKVLGFRVPIAKGDLDARTNPNGYGRIFTGNFRVYMIQIKLYWIGVKVWFGYTNLINHNAYAIAQPYCTGPGGYTGEPTLILSTQPSISQTGYKYEWLRYLFNAHFIDNGNGCGYAGARAGFKGIATLNLNFDACTDGLHFTLVPVQSALDYGKLGQYPYNHDIENEAIATKLSRVKPDVILGYPGTGIEKNKLHVGKGFQPFRNPEILNITQNSTISDPDTYFSCYGYNMDVKRSLLNLEIGDEELYLENAKLGWQSLYQAEFDINVNERNPYYEYVSSTPLAGYDGLYSKEEPFIIDQGGNATFMVDRGNSPTGNGLLYNPPFSGYYREMDTPLNVCCLNFIGARSKQPEPRQHYISENSELSVFPNPGNGSSITLRYQFKNEGIVRCEVINILGQHFIDKRLESQGSTSKNTYQLSIDEQLNNGIYFVRLSVGEEVLTKRLIVNHK